MEKEWKKRRRRRRRKSRGEGRGGVRKGVKACHLWFPQENREKKM
jgi:hypothetical protein